MSHANRNRHAPSRSRTPRQTEIVAFRMRVQKHDGVDGETAIKRCAHVIHATPTAWREWEEGLRRMHPAFWELLTKEFARRSLLTALEEMVAAETEIAKVSYPRNGTDLYESWRHGDPEGFARVERARAAIAQAKTVRTGNV